MTQNDVFFSWKFDNDIHHTFDYSESDDFLFFLNVANFAHPSLIEQLKDFFQWAESWIVRLFTYTRYDSGCHSVGVTVTGWTAILEEKLSTYKSSQSASTGSWSQATENWKVF